jgi:hypothetical protein
MKNIIYISLLISLVSCKSVTTKTVYEIQTKTDTLTARDTINIIDTFYVEYQTTDTVFIQNTDTIKIGNCDSLKERLFVSDYKLQRVRYYLNIAIKNPSQTKFLKGWIRRAIE